MHTQATHSTKRAHFISCPLRSARLRLPKSTPPAVVEEFVQEVGGAPGLMMQLFLQVQVEHITAAPGLRMPCRVPLGSHVPRDVGSCHIDLSSN